MLAHKWTENQGDTWSEERVIDGRCIYPSITKDFAGCLWVVGWNQADKNPETGRSALLLFKSLDQGFTWTYVGEIIDDVNPQTAGLDFEVLPYDSTP